jgi:hypothetical protein
VRLQQALKPSAGCPTICGPWQQVGRCLLGEDGEELAPFARGAMELDLWWCGCSRDLYPSAGCPLTWGLIYQARHGRASTLGERGTGCGALTGASHLRERVLFNSAQSFDE